MDLQEIKREIDSLNFDSKNDDKKDTQAFTFMGFNKIKLGIIAVFSFLFVYLVKPVFILNISYNPEKNEVVKKINIGKYFLVSLVSYFLFLFIIRRMFC